MCSFYRGNLQKGRMDKEIKTNWVVEKAEILEGGTLLDIHFRHRYDPRWCHRIQQSAEKWFKGQHAEFKLGELLKKLQPVLNYVDGRYEDG